MDPQQFLAQLTPADRQTFLSIMQSQMAPNEKFGAIRQLAMKYPGFHDESVWKNPAFIAGLAALTGGVASAAIPAIAGAGAGITTGPTLAQAGGSALAGGAGATTGLAGATLPSSIATVGGAGASGGIFGALKNMAGPLGNVLSTAAAANASGRREDAANTARAIAENNAAKTDAAKFNLNLPSVRTNQVARGEVLNTMQDAPLTGDPRIDKFKGGGLIPSAFGPQSRAAGAELSRQAMSGLMNPQTDRLTPQEIPGTHPSLGENIMGGAGLGLDIFSLLDKYGRNPNGVS